jgi:hypothetical protein
MDRGILARRKSMNKKSTGKKTPSKKNRRSLMTVDIVTGKELIYIYLDPIKVIETNNLSPEWFDEHFYTPASIVKEEPNSILTLRLINGEIVKVNGCDATKISPQDDTGVNDILNLRDFSEKSMIYTLRVRYGRDEIYTFVGPILISVNPYKTIPNLYNEETMVEYHQKKEVNHTSSSPL